MYASTKAANVKAVAEAKAQAQARKADASAARRHIRQCSPEELAELLSDYVNNYNVCGRDAPTAFALALMRQHRTLQQSMIRYFVRILLAYGDSVGDWHDLRNQGAADFCKRLIALVETKQITPYFPMV